MFELQYIIAIITSIYKRLKE